jgi:tRNA(fMet)-specific endonuclease VapC
MTLVDTNTVVYYVKGIEPVVRQWQALSRMERTAHESARIRAELEAGGQVIGPMDLLIAGTAMSRGAVLVTCNTREFSRVKGLRSLDWSR